MKNYIQHGRTVTLPAPVALVSGQGFLVGSIFAVANFAAAQSAPVEGDVEGVFDLPKTDAQAWTVGAPIYWDNTNGCCTTSSASNANKLIGAAMLPVANTAGLTTGRVRLNGAFVS